MGQYDVIMEIPLHNKLLENKTFFLEGCSNPTEISPSRPGSKFGICDGSVRCEFRNYAAEQVIRKQDLFYRGGVQTQRKSACPTHAGVKSRGICDIER
jgi:hypothetical protein